MKNVTEKTIEQEIKMIYQMSERYITGILLAIVGGFLDAYTYLCRGQVFANAQTGNMILFGIHIAEQDYIKAIYYLVPIAAFVVGTIVAEIIKHKDEQVPLFHWRQVVIAIEIIALIIVGFLPLGVYDTLANVLVSFVCALQVQSFRKMKGKVYATTMCTGNLRSGTEHMVHFAESGDKKAFHSGLQYYGIIVVFIIGAMIGALLTNQMGAKAVWFSCTGLVAVFVMMFKEA